MSGFHQPAARREFSILGTLVAVDASADWTYNREKEREIVGQQQLLLLTLGAIIVGIMIFVGMTMFDAHAAQSNKDAVTSSLQNIAADAYQFKMRPKQFGGGNPSYLGYTLPSKMQKDDNGNYQLSGTVSDTRIAIQGTSSLNTDWTATMTSDDSGKVLVTYNGW